MEFLRDRRPIAGCTESHAVCPVSPAPHPPPPPRIGFFDLETQRLADEVGGWQNKHLMRVSVAVLYETHTDTFKVFREEDIGPFLKDLQALDLVVGFNIASFDYEVLRAYTPADLRKLPTFDLLQEIHKVLGFRLSLAHLAENNLGKGKMSDGVQAVKWFREGAWDPLIEYCKLDVILTRDLFYRALETGYLLYSDRHGRALEGSHTMGPARFSAPWRRQVNDVRRFFTISRQHGTLAANISSLKLILSSL